jgi:hypothetical protein
MRVCLPMAPIWTHFNALGAPKILGGGVPISRFDMINQC